MYSRSYGLIEPSEKKGGFSVPPDYHGNFYRKEEKKAPPAEPPREIPEEPPPSVAREEKKLPSASGFAGGFLERLTAEDILLFVFLYSLLRGDGEDGNVLSLILALLLL